MGRVDNPAGPSSPLLFVELCAGTAALSLRLHGGRHARPPVSRMGAKTGYGEALLAVMGLRAGLRADRYLWCDPDPGVRLLLSSYRDRSLALKAAEIIRSWKDEPPRELWERLKAEGPAVCPDLTPDPRELARRVVLNEWSINDLISFSYCGPGKVTKSGLEPFSSGYTPDVLAQRLHVTPEIPPADIHPDAREVDPREVARWLLGEGWTNQGRYMGPDRPSNCHGSNWTASITREGIASRLRKTEIPPADIHPDAREVDPREVARWARIVTSNRLINLSAETWTNTGQGGNTFGGAEFCTDTDTLAQSFEATPGPLPADILPGAVYPAPRFPSDRRVVVFIDPPYVGTTGYGHDLPRAEVIELARAWADVGADVYISEAEPIPIPGWFDVEITGTRKGQKRTFSKQQREFVTCSRPPAWKPSQQGALFGILASRAEE